MSWISLAEIGAEGLFSDGDWVESKDQDPEGSVRLTQLADVGVGSFRDRSDRWMREDQASRLNCTFLEQGDVLIARMPDPIGRACLTPAGLGRAVTAVDVAVLRVNRDSFVPAYVSWMINAPQFHVRVEALQSGTTRKRISRKNLATLSIPRASLKAQRRIVEILEEHLSHLDAANAELACAARRLDALWSATLSGARAGDLIALPEIAEIQGGIQKQPKRAPVSGHYPFLRVVNVTANGLDLDDVHRVELFGDELNRLALRKGDLLVVEGNGSPTQIGRAAMWDGSIADCVHQNHLIRVRPRTNVLPTYLEAVWNSPENRRTLMDVSSSSSGLHTLSVSKLKQLMIPIPDIKTQQAIVQRVRTVRSALDRARGALLAADHRGSALRRAVLAAAFEGKLTGRHTDQEIIEETAESGGTTGGPN